MLTDGMESDDPVVAIAAPRPDFDGALLEFLIGMLTASLQAEDEEQWETLWKQPPSPRQLQAALDALPAVFSLDAEDGPRFLQDLSAADLAAQEVLCIDRLAIDSPGEQGVKLNKTLFVKAGRFMTLGAPAAAMALLTMQSYAPAGGAGNRTSMRGGGPLTTLVDPRRGTNAIAADEQPLWFKLWMNAETVEQWQQRARGSRHAALGATTFPWMAATLVSDSKKPPVTPRQSHALQGYFGMPRRIRLEFGERGRCGLTSHESTPVITGYRMRNYGVEYSGWKHPLSPHYAKDEEWLAVHPQPGGVSWKDWPDFALLRPAEGREPAACVTAAARRANRLELPEVRLHAFGYDMDNMKARAWVSAVQPLIVLPNPTEAQEELLTTFAVRSVEAVKAAATALSFAIKSARFERVEDAGDDPPMPRQQLWAETESVFFAALRSGVANGLTIEAVSDARRAMLPPLREITLRLFDEAVPLESAPVTALQRHVSARYSLTGTFAGFGKLGNTLYLALSFVPPKSAKATKTPKKTSSTKRGAFT